MPAFLGMSRAIGRSSQDPSCSLLSRMYPSSKHTTSQTPPPPSGLDQTSPMYSSFRLIVSDVMEQKLRQSEGSRQDALPVADDSREERATEGPSHLLTVVGSSFGISTETCESGSDGAQVGSLDLTTPQLQTILNVVSN